MQVHTDENTNLEAALDLLERGFHVIPLGSPEPAPPFMVQRTNSQHEADIAWPKTPRVKWKQYQTEPPSEQQVRDWWSQWPNANIGLLTGRVVVIDADSQEAVDFMESGVVTRTPWKVITGKGRHYYYQRNESFEIKNSVDQKVKLDVRGYGGYVVAPPSVHHNGNVYTWDINEAYGADDVMDLPVISPEDWTSIKGLNGAVQPTPNGLMIDTTGVNVKDTLDILPIDKGGRNNKLTRLVGLWISQGLPLNEVLIKATAWSNDLPLPLEEGEIKRTINSVSQTHTGNTGVIVPVERPVLEPFYKVWAHTAIAVIDNSDFVEDVVCDNQSSVFFGKSNTGKSFVVLDMLLHIALGRTWHGHQVEQGACVYIAAEGASGIINRIAAFRQYHKLAPTDIPLAVIPQAINFLDSEGDVARLILTIQQTEKDTGQKVKTIVVDTLARSLFGGDENSGTDMGQLITNMGIIIEKCHTHVGLIHHSGKDESRGARGHSSLRAAIDTEIEITQKDGITSAHATKQREMECSHVGDFTLSPVTLGTNKRGKPVTSCVVTKAVKIEILTPKESRTLTIIVQLINKNGNKKACYHVLKLDVREQLKVTGVTNGNNLASEKADFYRLIKGIENKGKIKIVGDFIELG